MAGTLTGDGERRNGRTDGSMLTTGETMGALSALFNPRAVAVLGVSEQATKHSRIAFDNAVANTYAGKVYPIHRKLTELGGHKVYATPADLPEQVDTVFMAIPADATLEALRDCAAAGVKVAILGSAGFAESGPEGEARQRELKRIVEEHGIRVVGPNCNGIYNATIGLALGYNTAHARRIPAGDVSILSHSGALFDMMISQLVDLGAGLANFVSVGNEADLDLLDYLEYVLNDPATRVITLLVDAIPDGERFRRLALRAQSLGKPIVALKIGLTERGSEAAVAHSSRLASGPDAYRALFEASGVSLVSSLEALMTASAMLSFYGRAEGGLAAFSTSGAGAALLADLCQEVGVRLADFSPATVEAVDKLRRFSRLGNPIDFGIFGERTRARDVPSIVAADPDVGVLLAILHAQRDWQRTPTMAAITQATRTSAKPFFILAPGGLSDGQRSDCEAAGLRVFKDSGAALQGVAAMLAPAASDTAEVTPASLGEADDALLAAERTLTEPESLALLARVGIPTVALRVCTGIDAAVAAADELGWPVVLKGVVPGLAHKSEAGQVHVDLADRAALMEAFKACGSPETVLIQRFVKGDVEAIAGLTRSPDVGPVLVAGLGGIYAESLRDVSMWAVPVSREAIRRKLLTASLGRVLTSPRWRHPGSLDALIDTLMRLQAFALAAGDRVAGVDLNPLVIGRNGVVAVDGLVVPACEQGTAASRKVVGEVA